MSEQFRDALKHARYGNVLGGFLLGAPRSRRDRERVLLDLVASIEAVTAIEHPSLAPAERDILVAERVAGYFDGMIKVVADKTIGLLQILSIVAALMGLLSGDEDLPAILIVAALAVIPGILITTLVLFPNAVFLSWRRPNMFYSAPAVRVRELYAVLLRRAHRLRLGQVLAFVILVLALAVTMGIAFDKDAISVAEEALHELLAASPY